MKASARPERVRASNLPLVIGIGNEHRGDDRCGRDVARALRGRLEGRARVIEHDGEPTGLLELWAGADLVIVVDAVRSGATPGTVHRFDVGSGTLPSPVGTTSTHGLSLAQAVGLGRSLGRLPRRLIVYGIEAAEVGMAIGLTPPVERAVVEVALRVDDDLRRDLPTFSDPEVGESPDA